MSGFPGAKHKKFTNLQQAQDYILQEGGFVPPQASTSASTSQLRQPVAVGAHSRARQDSAPKPAHRLPDYKQARPQPSARRAGVRDELVGSVVASRKVYCDGSSLGNGKLGAAAGMGVWWSNEVGAP